MSHQLKIENKTAILTLTIPAKTVQESMDKMAEQLAKTIEIKGFRKGKAPVDVVRKQIGEMELLDRSAEDLIRASFVEAMLQEDLETVGQPHFDAEKMAPGNDLVVKVTLTLQPNVTKLADLKKVKIQAKEAKATKEDIKKALQDLALMRTKETRVKQGTGLKKGDKAVVQLTMKQGGVVLEGGEGRNHGIYTGEDHYISGLVDKIIGMKEGETTSFTLAFPENHYQKHLAGKPVDFEVTLSELYQLEAPEINDEFAKSLGLDSKKALEEKIAENITAEKAQEEARRLEKELFDVLIQKSTFDEIPDVLVNQEIQKMVHELASNVKEQGMELEEYLKQIGKTLADIKLEFTSNALDRIKASLILKRIIQQEEIKVTEEELDKQVEEIAQHYKGNAEATKTVYEPQYRDYIEHQLKHQKALNWLKHQTIKS